MAGFHLQLDKPTRHITCMSLRAFTLAMIVLVCAPRSTAGIIYQTDFSDVVAGDADGKVLPPVAVFPALASTPGVWHRNSTATTSFMAAANTTVTDSVPPAGATGNAAARIGNDTASLVYLHQVSSQLIVAGTDYDFSFATRLALADGSVGDGEAAAGQLTFSVGYVNDDNTLNSFFTSASKPVTDISADQWSTHESLLSAGEIPADAIGKRIYLRLTHNVENTPDYFVWVDFVRVNAVEQSSSELSTAMTQLKNHINGTALLNISQINAITAVIDSNRGQIDDNAAIVTQAFDLISTYETVKGPLFVSTPVAGSFTRTDTSTVVRALAYSMLRVQQAVMDVVYTAANLVKYPDDPERREVSHLIVFPRRGDPARQSGRHLHRADQRLSTGGMGLPGDVSGRTGPQADRCLPRPRQHRDGHSPSGTSQPGFPDPGRCTRP